MKLKIISLAGLITAGGVIAATQLAPNYSRLTLSVTKSNTGLKQCYTRLDSIYGNEIPEVLNVTGANNQWHARMQATDNSYVPLMLGANGEELAYSFYKNDTPVILTSIPVFGASNMAGADLSQSDFGKSFLRGLTHKNIETDQINVLSVSGGGRINDARSYFTRKNMPNIKFTAYSSVPANLNYDDFDVVIAHVKQASDQNVANAAIEKGIPTYVSFPGTNWNDVKLAEENFGTKVITARPTMINKGITNAILCGGELPEEEIEDNNSYKWRDEYYQDCKDRANNYVLDTAHRNRRYAGLCNADGSRYEMHTPIERTGAIINVKDYGANPSNQDNYVAFKNALAAAKFGDEVYIPNGRYLFTASDVVDASGTKAHISVPTGVILRGQSREETILETTVGDTNGVNSVVSTTSSNVRIMSFTVTASLDDSLLPDKACYTDANNCAESGNALKTPTAGVRVANYDKNVTVQNVTVEDIKVEKFRSTGITATHVRDVIIRNNYISKASSLGGGGKGYGIHATGPLSAYKSDKTTAEYILIENNVIEGPQIRHAILLVRETINVAIRDNSIKLAASNAIDLHGRWEALTEISYNKIIDQVAGTGINVGHTTGPSSPGNWVYRNYLENKGGLLNNSCNAFAKWEENTLINTSAIEIQGGRDLYYVNNKIVGTSNTTNSIIHARYRTTNCVTEDAGYAINVLFENNTFEGIGTIARIINADPKLGIHEIYFKNNNFNGGKISVGSII